MPTAHARIPTDRASRYLAQLCRHLSELQHHGGSPTGHDTEPHRGRQRPQVQHVEWSDTHGTIDLGTARLTLDATPDTLDLTLDAPDDQTLTQLGDTIAHRIRTIGRRDRLAVTWQQPATPTAGRQEAPPSSHGAGNHGPGNHGPGSYRRRSTLALVAVAAVAIGMHAAVATAVLTGPSWMSWAADTVLVLVGLKLAAIALGGAALRHRLPHRIPVRRRQP